MKQHNTLKKIINALIVTVESEYQTNEATFKTNFFFHLKKEVPDHIVTVEENLIEHTFYNGRADFYLSDPKSKSYKNNVVIEFKNNCYDKKEIIKDIKKLEGFYKINKSISPIFINTFSSNLDFLRFLDLADIFAKTKVYSIAICPELDNFFYMDGLETKKFPLNKTTIITSCARLIEQRIIPESIPTVRIPNLDGMTKFINLYPNSKSNAYFKRSNKDKTIAVPYVKFTHPLR
ncbi:MAG: hypothetical protein JNJ40_12625 [Bacteroidia bacterium]|nr:hypothetical protein [Bacteroidia bacterium]